MSSDKLNSSKLGGNEHLIFRKPQFNVKYMDDNNELYLDNETDGEKRQERQDSQGSTSSTSPNSSRNPSHTKALHNMVPISTIEDKLCEPRRISNVSISSNSNQKERNNSVQLNPSKSHTSFISMKHDRSSQSSKRSGKRASLLHRILPSRKGSEISDISTDISGYRSSSVSSRKSDPHRLSLFMTQKPVSNDLRSQAQIQKKDIQSYANNHAHKPLISTNGRKLSPSHITNNSSSLPKSLNEQGLHGTEFTNEDDIISVPMSAANTIARSYGISLLDDNDDDELPLITNASMSRVASATSIPMNPSSDKAFWRPPDSWKVRNESIIPEIENKPHNYAMESIDSDLSSSVSNEGLSVSSPSSSSVVSMKKGQSSLNHIPLSHLTETNVLNSNGKSKMRRSPKELKGSARSSVRIFKGEKSSLLPCTLETTCGNILDILRRKRFLKQDDDHMLVLKCGGLTRTLALNEKPLKIQRSMLFLYGYIEKDNLDYIERTDLSFLFKFIVEEKSVKLISEEKKRLINPQIVDLANWNLQDIPNFLYAEPMVTLDVSRNPSFEFTKDFMHDSRNLTTLLFTRSGSQNFPISIVYTPRLVNLDLEVNYIKNIPNEISMLSSLNMLNLACNRISRLPDSFGLLSNLQSLNLSSNRLRNFPPQILKLEGLKKLDLSYNAISLFPVELSSLKNLEVLQIAGNKIFGDLPDFFSSFDQLIKVDVRFNKLTSIDALKSSNKMEVIRATGNNISVFRSMASNLFEVELNMNPLTYVYFGCGMTNLKVVDFSKGKLTSCSFTSQLVSVEKLLLDHNHLSVLPDSIQNMKNLTHFSIFKNNLTSLPDVIVKLTKLKYLDLHLNNIGRLNQNIWNLGSLEILNLASNLLESFPDAPDHLFNNFPAPVQLAKFKSMNTYEVSDAISNAIDDDEGDDDVTDLPKSLASMQLLRKASEATSNSLNLVDKDSSGLAGSLKCLCLCDNKLTDTCIPTISLLFNLESLNLSYNEIFEIPPGYISRFTELTSLFLSGNYMSSLPIEDLDVLQNVKTLHLNGNKFGTLPAELSKLTNLSALDVGSNQLKYNIGNIPYDWNWCYNKKLKFLNFSGNKRLEIKPQHNHNEYGEKLDSFLGLKQLKMLGLMDVTITTDAVPDQSVGTRIRSTVSQLGKFGYGISDSLGESDSLTTRDVVIEKFRGNADEFLITIYDGKNSVQHGGDKISKIIQETFEFHLTEELKTLGECGIDGDNPKTVEDCMRGAFLTMNSEMNILLNKDESSTFSSAAAHRTKTTDKLTIEEDGLSGCSATIIYIMKEYIYIANVGDIMGILTKSDGEFNVITTKHEPYAPKEYDRIRDSGGYVTTDGYLDGVSDVSRAVGFFKLIPHINSKPSIHKFELTQNDEMIAICTNEIWKKVTFELAADIIRQEKSNPLGAAEKLRDFAISYGSRDKKVTAVVLSLRQFTTKQKYHSVSRPEDSILRKLDDEIEPPTGELAMVFTDIKNSTLLWDNYPLAMRSAIKVHNSIMRRQLRIIGGYEVKTEGDAFIVSFPTPTAALLWCFIVQSQLLTTNEWPEEILSSDQGFEVKDNEGNLIFRGLSVRMGIHWGAPVCEMDIVTKRMDYFGPMVNRASRVSSVADGGQITMSTDYHHEMEKVKKIHQMIKDGKLDINRSYGYKAKNKDVENQMKQLENIGMVIEHIGAKKLKGLETPENIWLIFPKPLGSRLKILTNEDGQIQNKMNKLIVGGITIETAWILRKIALRLEKICSYFSQYQNGSSHSENNNFREGVKKEAEEVMTSKVADVESFLLLFLDHTITRIENCVFILGTRQILGEEKTTGIDSLHLLDAILDMKKELAALKYAATNTNNRNID